MYAAKNLNEIGCVTNAWCSQIANCLVFCRERKGSCHCRVSIAIRALFGAFGTQPSPASGCERGTGVASALKKVERERVLLPVGGPRRKGLCFAPGGRLSRGYLAISRVSVRAVDAFYSFQRDDFSLQLLPWSQKKIILPFKIYYKKLDQIITLLQSTLSPPG